MAQLGSLINDRYRLERLIDQTESSSCFLAHDTIQTSPVVLRLMPGTDNGLAQRLVASAEALNQVQHPAIPALLATGASAEGQFVVWARGGGVSLEERRRLAPQGRLAIPYAVLAILPVLDALSKLHAVTPPIIHGDLRPANIFVSDSGTVSLTNFALGVPGAPTPWFAAPEQQRGQSGPQADLYAVGATLYTLVSGVLPPPAATRLANDRLIAPTTLLPDLQPGLAAALQCLLSPQPADRYANAATAAAALQEALPSQVCPACAMDNRPTARFCKRCGEPLAMNDPASVLARYTGAAAINPALQPASALPDTEPLVAAPIASPLPAPAYQTPHTPPPPTVGMPPPPVGMPPPPVGMPPPPAQAGGVDRRWLIFGGIAALVLCLLAFLGLFALLRGPEETTAGNGAGPATAAAVAATATPEAEAPTAALDTAATTAAEATATARSAATATAAATTAEAASAARATATARSGAMATAQAAGQTAVAAQTLEAGAILAQTALAASATAAVPTATVPPPPPTAPPARLRFSLFNSNDDPTCFSVQIRGVSTAGWRFAVDGIGAIAGNFDGGGNARACGLSPNQEVTFSVFNRNGAVVRGGAGVPVRGGNIMIAEWR